MGGRGGSSGLTSGKIQAIEVDYGNGSRSSFRLHSNGRVTDIDNFGEQKNTNNLSLEEITKRARDNGYSVKTYTSSDLKDRDEKRRKERENRPDYELGVGVPWGNAEYRKTARRNRISTRAQRRKK